MCGHIPLSFNRLSFARMSLLTDYPNTIQCSAYFTEEASNLDVVYVSQHLWESLTDLKQEHGESSLAQISPRVAISIKFKKYIARSAKRQKGAKLKNLVAWAEVPSRVRPLVSCFPNGLTVLSVRQTSYLRTTLLCHQNSEAP